MAAAHQVIEDKVVGDAIPVERTYTVPNGITVSKAYLAVKEKEEDLDANAVFPLIQITTTPTTSGQVTTATSVAGVIAMRFRIAPADSILLTPYQVYHYCVKMISSSNDPYTLEKGTILLAESGVDTSA